MALRTIICLSLLNSRRKKMRLIFGLLLVALVASVSSAAIKTELGLSTGAGLYSGMYGVGGDILWRTPQALEDDNLYIRSGMAVTDSRNLSTWRQFAPVYVDGLFYINKNLYAGAGLNYPVKVSDGDTGALGWQSYLGGQRNLWDGDLFVELGYSSLRRTGQASFDGSRIMGGYRHNLATVVVADKPGEATVAALPNTVIVEGVVVNEVVLTEGRQLSRAEDLKIEQEAALAETVIELRLVGENIEAIDKQIIEARKLIGDLVELKQAKLDYSRSLRTREAVLRASLEKLQTELAAAGQYGKTADVEIIQAEIHDVKQQLATIKAELQELAKTIQTGASVIQ
jgi:hypothetical protein